MNWTFKIKNSDALTSIPIIEALIKQSNMNIHLEKEQSETVVKLNFEFENHTDYINFVKILEDNQIFWELSSKL